MDILEGAGRSVAGAVGAFAGFQLARREDKIAGAVLGGLAGYFLPLVLFGEEGSGVLAAGASPGAGDGGAYAAPPALPETSVPWTWKPDAGAPSWELEGDHLRVEDPDDDGSFWDLGGKSSADGLVLSSGYRPECDPASPLFAPDAC